MFDSLSLSRMRCSRPFHFDAWNECVLGRMCVYCQIACNASCNPPSCSSFLVGSQYRFREGGPVRAHADGCLSVPYSGIATGLAPWSAQNQLPLQHRIPTAHQDQVIPYCSALKPLRALPYDVAVFRGENQVSPLSDRNKTRGCQEVSC